MAKPKLDANLTGLNAETGEHACLAEDMGFDGLWTPELDSDPFLPLSVVADRTEELGMGTRIATAFTRSPMVLAYAGWDLARLSEGRFTMSLGTQVKAHNERRFSVEWSEPTPRLREVVESVRHIWDYWQGRTDEFGYDGDHYSFSLMTTVFNPGPIEHPDVPIHLAAVNEGNVRLAGELGDGICLHPFNTTKYTNERVVPWLEDSAEQHGRSLDDITVSVSPLVVTGETEKEMKARREAVRMRVAFYGSTPSYKPVMQTHGWEDTGRKLWELSKEGRWGDMISLVTDDMVEEFAVEAPLDEIADTVLDEYGDVADRIVLEIDEGFDGQEFWRKVADGW